MYKAETKNINFYYGDFHALKDVSLAFPDKTVTALIGPSGCGKSTLLYLMGGFMPLQHGQITVNGKVVTGPGPGSGKLATCLSQLYHEHQRGRNAHYAKFETFPIWNLPLKHEVNVAYEAATAELKDVNLIDHFHLEAHGQPAVNYNRDIEAFPLVRRILERINGQPSCYQSPTDMGVNRAGFGIVDDAACRAAARQEIIRRYFNYACEYAMGLVNRETVIARNC